VPALSVSGDRAGEGIEGHPGGSEPEEMETSSPRRPAHFQVLRVGAPQVALALPFEPHAPHSNVDGRSNHVDSAGAVSVFPL